MDEPRKVKTLNGEETKKKKSFFVSDIKTVFASIVSEFVEPIVKNMIVDGVHNALNMLIFNDPKKREAPKLPFNIGGNLFNFQGSTSGYNTQYNSSPIFLQGSSNIQTLNTMAGRFAYERIRVASEDEGRYALSVLQEKINLYGFVRVSDLDDILNISGDWTDSKYGWNNILSARIMPVNDNVGGVVLVMPTPLPIQDKYFK